ncbi:zinc/manganese transport system substrate-binding protein/manganese/iron transport system substrate-binding protein [Microcella alkaliphila]|uniref:Zinc/manganese transport system substrate-binding protein/manganese/iron transport system substrate-binding protein n=1 Tax=Microcella alkaliphila TaxID=279828 RepID=A0A4Q7TIN0_9MICO|nr:metal ABC transporter substrate-binding protein [Microcella alkaliphila]RZT59697.1 zinc/manganese transport system substrate-binding protein/manganese/iron transport system substrate-binding protein [Microcella alkaliphila]
MTTISPHRSITRGVPALIAASVLAIGLAGCATAEPDADAATPEAPVTPALTVVASTTHTAEFTQRVAGDLADVTALIQANQSTHSFDPTASDLAALADADVLVINGAGLEEWLDDAVQASGFAGTTVDASTRVGLIEFAGDHDHGEGEHADGRAHDDHGHDDHGHSYEGDDPHIWTSAANAAAMVEAIAEGLAAADAANAEVYEANAAAYIAQLEQLDAWIIESVGAVDPADRLLVTNHEAFGYFVDAYDVTYVGAIIPSFDDNAEVSAADIDRLVASVRDSGATAVFSETTLSPAAAETIAAEAGIDVLSGEQGLYGDSLGPAGSPGETYIGSMIHNVTVLVTAWGAEPAPVPAALAE